MLKDSNEGFTKCEGEHKKNLLTKKQYTTYGIHGAIQYKIGLSQCMLVWR